MRSYAEKSAVAGIGGTMDNKVKMINVLTGSEMLVAEHRVEEYKAAGHKLAASDTEKKPAKEAPKSKPKAKKK